MTTTTNNDQRPRPGDQIQTFWCSDCQREHTASVLGGAVVPPERGTQLQSLREVESERIEQEDYDERD